jgi:hypothetical protein
MTDHGAPDDNSSKSSAMDKFFGEETKRELLDEDREAWKMVCGILFSIVFGGVLLGFLGVMLAT